MEREQIREKDDMLYQQALSSLRKLNQDVLLNDLESKLEETIETIQLEINELNDNNKDNQLYLSSTINDLKEVVRKGSAQSTDQNKTLDKKVKDYLNDLYSHFSAELERVNSSVKTSTLSSKRFVENHVDKYEKQLQAIQKQYMEMVEHVDQRVIEMQSFDEHFKEELERVSQLINESSNSNKKLVADHISKYEERLHVIQTQQQDMLKQVDEGTQKLEELYSRWFLTMGEVRDDYGKQAEIFNSAHVQQRQLLENTRKELIQIIEGIDESRLTWVETSQAEQTARIENETILRHQLLEDVNVAQEAISEAALTKLRDANEELMLRYEARDKLNRLILIGLTILSATQVVLHFI